MSKSYDVDRAEGSCCTYISNGLALWLRPVRARAGLLPGYVLPLHYATLHAVAAAAAAGQE